jgi:hypothetical protein
MNLTKTKTFHIKHEHTGYIITLETNKTKFDSLEQLLYLIGLHFIDKGKTDEIKSILEILNDRLNEKRVLTTK